jgi:DTW domain-containing protein YfiP
MVFLAMGTLIPGELAVVTSFSSVLFDTMRLKHAAVARGVGILDHVERTLRNVASSIDHNSTDHIKELPLHQREPVSIARNLSKRLPHVGCQRCWLRPAHCICHQLQPAETLPFEKIFVLMHHNEVGLALDTAKIIFATFPETSRLVVGGIPSQYQASMNEMEEAIADETCVVLFPKDGAPLVSELFMSHKNDTTTTTTQPADVSNYPNLIVIDGTWEQARRLHAKYIPVTTQHVQLNLVDNKLDEEGRQLRPHPIPIREIATVHALQLLAEDLGLLLPLREYHRLAKAALRAQQLTPPPPLLRPQPKGAFPN